MANLRRALHEIEDVTEDFVVQDLPPGRQQLFTDGSCLQHANPEFCLATWAVVNATTGMMVACGPLPGLLQTTPRAELTVALSAVRWAIHRKVAITLWMDAYYIAQGISEMLVGRRASSFGENHDLWASMYKLIGQLDEGQLLVQHVPSHLDASKCDSPFEEWVATWNQHVDTAAGLVNAPTDRCSSSSSISKPYEAIRLNLGSYVVYVISFSPLPRPTMGRSQKLRRYVHHPLLIQFLWSQRKNV